MGKEVIQNPTVNYLQGRVKFSQLFGFLSFRESVTPAHALPLNRAPAPCSVMPCACAFAVDPSTTLTPLTGLYFLLFEAFQSSVPKDDLGGAFLVLAI